MRVEGVVNHLVSGLFVALVFSPMAVSISYDDQIISESEKRVLVDRPARPRTVEELEQFPVRFESYFDDHFGLRDALVRAHNTIRYQIGSSPTEKAIVGDDSWLFVASPEYRVIEGYRNIDTLSPRQLEAWSENLLGKRNWLQSQGIDYVFTVAPNKHTIYSEHLPRNIRKVGSESRYDQLLGLNDPESRLPLVVDLRPDLLAAKEDLKLYYERDTHWNSLGASIAQRALMHEVQKAIPELVPTTYSPEDFVWGQRMGGDLWKMLNTVQRRVSESDPAFPVESPCHEKLSADGYPEKTLITSCAAREHNLVMFRDSFTTKLQPYLSEYFDRSVYVWTFPNLTMIRDYASREKPRLVIEQRVERGLFSTPRNNDLQLNNFAYRPQFESASQHILDLDQVSDDQLRSNFPLTIGEAGEVVFESDARAYVKVTDIPFHDGRRFLAKLVATVPQAGRVVVNLPHEDAMTDEERDDRTYFLDIPIGKSTVYIPILVDDFESEIMIHFPKSGKHTIHRLEIVAVPPLMEPLQLARAPVHPDRH